MRHCCPSAKSNISISRYRILWRIGIQEKSFCKSSEKSQRYSGFSVEASAYSSKTLPLLCITTIERLESNDTHVEISVTVKICSFIWWNITR